VGLIGLDHPENPLCSAGKNLLVALQLRTRGQRALMALLD
jgi:hypothetical protein